MIALVEKVKEFVRHNLGLSVMTVVTICVLIFFIGCQATVVSPVSGERVNRGELMIEYQSFTDKMLLAQTDLDTQDKMKEELSKIAVTLAEGGTLDPVGIATALIALLGIGSIADNVTKDRIIKTQSNVNKPS